MPSLESELMKVVRRTRYPLEAFLFVQRGLDYTARRVHGEPGPHSRPGDRHVSGQVLCQGLRDYAIEQYGLLARTVLNHWRIYSTEDFGKIVFAMVEAGLLQKTPEDSIRDFDCVYDFDQAFPRELRLAGEPTEPGRRPASSSPSKPAP